MSTELALTAQQAINNINEQFPAEAQVLAAISRKDIVALGEEESYVLKDANGNLKAFKSFVEFSIHNGTVDKLGWAYAINNVGYERWLSAVGGYVHFPDDVIVNGNKMPNPYPIEDPSNGRISKIYARAVACYINPRGIPQRMARTTIYEVPAYRMIDLLGKAKEFPQAFALMPKDSGSPKEDGRWSKYSFDEATDFWVNVAHPEAIGLFASIINREKKAMEFAQTFAQRNAIKHLCGLQKPPIVGEREYKGKKYPVYAETWRVPVICWKPVGDLRISWDETTRQYLENQAGFERRDLEIMPDAGRDYVTREEVVEVIEQEQELGDPPDVIDISPPDDESEEELTPASSPAAAMESQPNLEEEKMMANLAEAIKEFPEEYARVCAVLNLKQGANHTAAQAADIMRSIHNLLDIENGGEE